MSRLLLLITAAIAFTASALAQAKTWKIDPNHTAAQFSVRHLGISTVRGAFTKVSGTATYDPADPGKDSIEVTIDASSVDTRVEMRDNDLRSPNFFDVAKYPTLTFKSKRVEVAGAGKLKVTGDLTIRDVTRELRLPFTFRTADEQGVASAYMNGKVTIRRLDFGVGQGDWRATDQVGDAVAVSFALRLTPAH